MKVIPLVDGRHFVVTTSPLSIYSEIVSRNKIFLARKNFFNSFPDDSLFLFSFCNDFFGQTRDFIYLNK